MCSWLWMLYQPLSIDNFVSIANTIMMVISALSILQSFPTRRIGRDRISFNSVLPAGERRRHWSMFDCSAGIAPDEISFNTVLGSLDKALRHAVTMDSLLTSPLSELWLRAGIVQVSRAVNIFQNPSVNQADDDFDHTSVLLDEVPCVPSSMPDA
ncbi:hypothetical protein AK812_SmicGene10876 [Symbiodinium microadriaticum]|uniref:Uncharacterized protein n=1 Tax=Symbiodinium microadriaticum TaxID=2951 RepID=A0A1Q9EET2_SYMMI|nr:hypothetical protein AK812_SmicGene10876 [Symbiodinium microadriaticum]